MKNRFILLILSIITLASCMKDAGISVNHDIVETIVDTSASYDKEVYDFSKALNKALSENQDFRYLVKNEVQKQFDGDYDLLVKCAFEQDITPSDIMRTKSGCCDKITVKELLSYYYDDDVIQTKSSSSVLDELIAKYPNLQISIPVHADNWNPETYIPNIAIIPEDYEDLVTEEVPGLDSEGNDIVIDALNAPDEPVIVVGLSERISSDIAVTFSSRGVNQIPSITLLGIYTNQAVQLTYTMNNTTSLQSVKIYRTNANSYSFVHLANMYGPQFLDWTVEQGKYYSYYITATCVSTIDGQTYNVTSQVINIATNDNVPKPVSNLSVVNEYARKNFITWTNPSSQNYPTLIYKTTPNMTDRLIATLEPTVDYYYDEPSVPGEKWSYVVKKHNPNTGSVSSHKKTFLYNPYRNPSGKSKVMLKKIHIDIDELEGWLDGRPEFYITTFGYQKNNNGALILDTLSTIDHQFDDRASDSEPLNKLMADWSFFDDSNYYPILNIHMREYDRGTFKVTLNANANIGYKQNDDISIVAMGSFTYEYKNRGQECGTVTLRYYENPEQNLTFPNYGSYITISEIDSNNQ